MRLIDADEFKKYLIEGTEEELKEAFAKGILTKETEKRTEDVLKGFLMDIDEQPTIDPATHAKWIKKEELFGDEKVRTSYYQCSECGRIESHREPYCHCGAKMDKED